MSEGGGKQGPRERIVYHAAQQLRTHGADASSLRAIVRDADAPWGSLRHYFPGGKDQILSEALEWSGAYAAADIETYMKRDPSPTPGGLFVHLVDSWATELARRDFRRGCPVAAASFDASGADSPVVRATRSALDRWLAAIETALRALGVADTGTQARIMLSALEGAIILSRVQQSTTPLTDLKSLSDHFDGMP
jgi:AcrR family transcriptional regulator